MSEFQTMDLWLKSIFNINREIDFERENAQKSLERLEQLEKKKREIFDVIECIENPTYKAILYKRYVQGEKWEQISEELNYAYTHIVDRLYKKAVVEVCKVREGQK